MVSTHESIAIGLATELRAFCKREFIGDQWFRWEWPDRVVEILIDDGVIKAYKLGNATDPATTILGFFSNGVGSGIIAVLSVPIVECDLAHPDLVEIFREKLSI